MTQTDRAPPPGYRLFPQDKGFVGLVGPLYWMVDAEGLHLGIRIEDHHCNPTGSTHGGLISTLLDMQLPIGVRHLYPDLADYFLFTISLNMDFLAPVHVGQWLWGRTQVLKRTKRMAFAQGFAMVGDEIVVRASGSFRIGPNMRGDLPDFVTLMEQDGLPRNS